MDRVSPTRTTGWASRAWSQPVLSSLRAIIGLVAPLVVGIATGHPAQGTLVALGALWGVSQDGIDAWPRRRARLLGATVTAGIGVTVGSLVSQQLSVTADQWTVLAVLALAAGLIESSGWGSQGMYLLLAAIVGDGLRIPGPAWQTGVQLALGTAWVYALAAITNWRGRRTERRLAVAAGLDAVARLLEHTGPDLDRVLHRAVAIVDEAQDVVADLDPVQGDAEDVALHQCFAVLLQAGEYASMLRDTSETTPAGLPPALRRVADRLRTTTARSTVALLREAPWEGPGPWRRVLVAPGPGLIRSSPPFRSSLSRLSWAERWRFALLLTSTTVAAGALAAYLHGPRGYWLPMTVVFVLRPDSGPVLQRSLARIGGTVLGVAIAGAVAALGNAPDYLIGLCVLMAGAIPWTRPRSYALTVMCFTPIVFTFIGLLHPSANYLGVRMLDTVIGALAVLAVDRLAWVRAPSLRPQRQLERARGVVADYEATTPDTEPVTRHTLRRKALRALARTSAAIEETRAERRRAGAGRVEIAELRRRVDAHTTELLVGAPPPPDARGGVA